MREAAVSYDPDTIATRKLKRIDERLTELFRKREDALRERGRELGFLPCGDCFDGFCTMNCSTAPTIMKVSYP